MEGISSPPCISPGARGTFLEPSYEVPTTSVQTPPACPPLGPHCEAPELGGQQQLTQGPTGQVAKNNTEVKGGGGVAPTLGPPGPS